MKNLNDIKVVVYPVEEEDNPLVRRFTSRHDGRIEVYRDHHHLQSIVDELKELYHSKEVIILQHFPGRQYQMCPGSPNMICCNYRVINTCFDCLYNCTYCFLNFYRNSYGIVQFLNVEEVIEEIRVSVARDKENVYRIGTGEFTDSLMMDDVTGIAEKYIVALAPLPNVMLEFKTKSSKVDHLLDIKEKGKTVLAWSVNTEAMIDDVEEGAATLDERIEAAKKAAGAGFLLAFHFDPVIVYEGFQADYLALVDRLTREIDMDRVAWISLGMLRYTPAFRDIVRERFPGEDITKKPQVRGLDGKLRYPKHQRIELYRAMVAALRAATDVPYLYLCMEAEDVWFRVFNREFHSSEELEKDFSRHLREKFF